MKWSMILSLIIDSSNLHKTHVFESHQLFDSNKQYNYSIYVLCDSIPIRFRNFSYLIEDTRELVKNCDVPNVR